MIYASIISYMKHLLFHYSFIMTTLIKLYTYCYCFIIGYTNQGTLYIYSRPISFLQQSRANFVISSFSHHCYRLINFLVDFTSI